MNFNFYKNSEGYPDPTYGEAAYNIEKYEAERLAAIKALIPVLRKTAELVGFDIVGRITFVDRETGKRYK